MTVPMKIFVSYSRSVKTDVGKVIDLLRAIGHEVWWDGDIPIMADWWATILDKVEWCDVFIFVVSEKSVQSPYCLLELSYATERNRPILPFVIDASIKYTIPAEVTPMRAQWYVYNDDPADIVTRLKDGIANIQRDKHRDVYAQRPPEPNTNATSIIKLFQDAQKLAHTGKFEDAKRAFRNVKSLDYGEWGVECDEWVERINRYAEIYELASDKATMKRAITKWDDFKARFGADFDPFDLVNNPPVLPALTPPPMPKPVFIPREPIIETTEYNLNPITSDASQMDNIQPKEIFPVPKRNSRIMAMVIFGLIMIFGLITLIVNNFNNLSEGTVLNSIATNTRRSATVTSPSTEASRLNRNITPTLDPLYARATQIILEPSLTAIVLTSTFLELVDWTPQERDFDGVTMVFVPSGCFIMGSDNDTSDDDEKPVYAQCFGTPFWIDKYEVTQSQFAQFGGQKSEANYWSGDDLPVENITWFEARDFCDLRGGRLPTEAEWEYAARGPSNWVYPWGDEFVTDNVVHEVNSGGRTATVGSRPDGASWVGALDMVGNVWEWTSSLYQGYPYNQNDESVDDNISMRVLRGGAWDDTDVHSANRNGGSLTDWGSNGGFRCLRFE